MQAAVRLCPPTVKKMSRLSGPPLLLLLLTLCLSSAQDNANLEVLYTKKHLTPPRGSSVPLSCEAYFDFVRCGGVHVVWQRDGDANTELSDPSKYLTTVNETALGGGMRRRQVVTEVVKLTAEDDGAYQCHADCENGDAAMGHFIRISVQG